MVKAKKADISEVEELGQRFSKQQLVCSKKYAHIRDLVSALLVDSALYATQEVDTLIRKYNEREV